jgi:tocopherol O-methyltransferase
MADLKCEDCSGAGSLPVKEPKPGSVTSFYDAIRLDNKLLAFGNGYPHFHLGYYSSERTSHKDAALQMSELVFRNAQIKGDHSVLDLGCGYGATSILVAKNFGAQTIGIANSFFFVRSAHKFARKAAVENEARFVAADMHCIPFGDDHFDRVIAIESISHSTNLETLYGELSRTLAPGGLVVVADFFRSNSKGDALEEDALATWERGWCMSLAAVDDHQLVARKAGLELIVSQDISARVAPSVVRLSRLANIFYPVQLVAHYCGARSDQQHLSAKATRSMIEIWRAQLLQFHLLVYAKR